MTSYIISDIDLAEKLKKTISATNSISNSNLSTHNNLCIVDLCKRDLYLEAHIPSAIWLDRNCLVSPAPNVGLIPDENFLRMAFAHLPLDKAELIVAYDDEGGKVASRFLWILDYLGYKNWALLDGGLNLWIHNQQPITGQSPTNPAQATAANDKNQTKALNPKANILLEELLDVVQHHPSSPFVLLDARSLDEYNGNKIFAHNRGHIPGAKHYEWLRLLDLDQKGRLRSLDSIKTELVELGITTNKTVITYCQSHMRASLMYVVLKALGFDVRGYGGSWGEWGNNDDCPVEY